MSEQKLQEAMNRGMDEALKVTIMHVTKLQPVDRVPYLSAVFQLAFQFLRDGGKQDDFVRGLIDGALADLKKPALINIKDMRVN